MIFKYVGVDLGDEPTAGSRLTRAYPDDDRHFHLKYAVYGTFQFAADLAVNADTRRLPEITRIRSMHFGYYANSKAANWAEEAMSLCRGHYAQRWHVQELKPLPKLSLSEFTH